MHWQQMNLRNVNIRLLVNHRLRFETSSTESLKMLTVIFARYNNCHTCITLLVLFRCARRDAGDDDRAAVLVFAVLLRDEAASG
jgi:hypothetical protein